MIELRVPISPTPSFLNQVLLLASSLRRFHSNAIIRVYIGHPLPMSRDHTLVDEAFQGKRIGYEWVVGKEFEQWGGNRAPFLGTMNRRWGGPVHGDHVIIADADILFTGTLDDLLCRDAVQGVQAHERPLTKDEFRYLFTICDAPEPQFEILYTGAGFMAPPNARGCPYPNSGMIVLPREHFKAMAPHYQMAINRMRQAIADQYWFDQLAVAVAIGKAGVPYIPLPMRYNFPNQLAFEEHYPDELRDVRVLHYLRENQISRTRDFESVAALRQLVQRSDFTGSHEILRRAIAANLSILEPPPLGSPGTEPSLA